MRARPFIVEGKKRFRIEEKDGRVMDDAQGYGYKTKTKAQSGWRYKSKHDLIPKE